jgi:nucleotide-binding universal stress UspA family protein
MECEFDIRLYSPHPSPLQKRGRLKGTKISHLAIQSPLFGENLGEANECFYLTKLYRTHVMEIKKVLIAIDDSKFSEHAAEYGFDIARSYSAEVGLVHIVEPIVYPPAGNDTLTGIPFEVGAVTDKELITAQTESSENIISRTIKKFAGDLQVTHFTEYGLTAEGILGCSREFNADLIVVGTHSRTGLDRLLMGSVAEYVVRHSDVPVLVVPLKEES